MAYGQEVIIDLYGCDVILFNREDITKFFEELCDLLHMTREDLHFWDYADTPPEEVPNEKHLVGTSAIQFITTSNITIHTLDKVAECYINIFSCKPFSAFEVRGFARDFFKANRYTYKVIPRGIYTHCEEWTDLGGRKEG